MVSATENWSDKRVGPRTVRQCDMGYLCLTAIPLVGLLWIVRTMIPPSEPRIITTAETMFSMFVFVLMVVGPMVVGPMAGVVLSLMNRWNRPLLLLAVIGFTIFGTFALVNFLPPALKSRPFGTGLSYVLAVALFAYPLLGVLLSVHWFGFARKRWRQAQQ